LRDALATKLDRFAALAMTMGTRTLSGNEKEQNMNNSRKQ
jgi:hypothetical protein